MTTDLLPLVDVGDIIRLVGRGFYERSRTLARDGSVLEYAWDASTEILTGRVRDGAGPFAVTTTITATERRFGTPSGSTCECPLGGECSHVAALILVCNAAAARQKTSVLVDAEPAPVHTPEPALSSWKSAVVALTGGGFASVSASALAQPATTPPKTTAMALYFEVREQKVSQHGVWPPARERSTPSGSYRLSVRPAVRNELGNWVRTGITWHNMPHQLNRMSLNPEQHRWFGEFSALYRAARLFLSGAESDWFLLDNFTSPLLWTMLERAKTLGIPLIVGKKGGLVERGGTASVRLDASATEPAGGTAGSRATVGCGVRLTTVLEIDGVEHPALSAGTLGDHGVYAWTLQPELSVTIAPLEAPLGEEERALLGRPGSLEIPPSDVEEFLREYAPFLARTVELTSDDGTVEFPVLEPSTLVLNATFRPKHVLHLEWGWEHPVAGYRNEDAELEVLDRLADELRIHPNLDEARPEVTAMHGIEAAEFTEKVLPKIEALDGIRVAVRGERPDYRELTESPVLTVKTVESEHRDWFDLGVILTVGGRDVPFGPLFKALSSGKKKLLLADSSYLALDHPALDELRELIAEAQSLDEWESGPGIRISRYQTALWAEFEDLADVAEPAVSWRETVAALGAVNEIEPVALPNGLDATLRPYQREGFNWLAFLWRHALGGVLADDMGLGKTVQALALIAHAIESREGKHAHEDAHLSGSGAAAHPFLVVAPTSVVSNWAREAARFVPRLRVHTVGAGRAGRGEKLAEAASGADILITSYALFRLNFDSYQALGWAGLILDEAQFVKNRASRAHTCARDLETPFKLAITGTPMENNLLELWSMFAIVAPGLFPSARRFTENYVRPLEKGAKNGNNTALLARLRRRIRPLMMRRTKSLVAPELPDKLEQLLRIDLEPKHQKLYDTFLQRERQKLLGLIDDLDKNRFIVFRSLTLLRMLSLDAALIDERYAVGPDAVPSSKLNALFEQLEDVVSEGHRALVFSQFTSFLKRAAARLEAQGIPYCYLDGSTRHRSEVIDQFKTGEAPVFLVSLKAGGFGLNLTEADYVFLLDPWWNPASEEQAIDRTHRIGQSKNVMVYRLVANGTIEEKVMALKEKKAKLFTAVLDDDAVFSSALSPDDIRGLLEP